LEEIAVQELDETSSITTRSLTPTGITGLDEILGGGIPSGRVVLVLGEPGAGKTTLCSHFLANGYSKYGEDGVYISLEESRNHLFREMAGCGIDFAVAEKNRQFGFVDASPIRHVPNVVKAAGITIGKKEFSMVSLMDSIRRAVDAIDATRVVVDPLSYLMFQYRDPAELRAALLDLIEGLSEMKATVLMTSELKNSGSIVRKGIQMEEYVAHGTIIMQSVHVGKSLVRVLQVQKMRECDADREPRPYRITKNGIEVYAKESIF
jgi:KaiC/GvpD/RAD55 family RecA-like ATPase